MRREDVWVIILIVLILSACFRIGHEDIPDKAEVVPETPTPQPTPEMSACEIENEFLKIEADMWREKYFNQDCE